MIELPLNSYYKEITLPKPSQTMLVVDDHPIFRNGVCEILLAIDPEAKLLKADTGREAIAQIKSHIEIDWIFLDYKLPDTNAITLLSEFTQLNLFASVVVVSSEDRPEVIDEILRAGANGFLSKASEKEAFALCIKHIESGQQYIHEHVLASLQQFRSTVLAERQHIMQSLSERQLEVLTLLAKGLSNLEIGQTLSISESTVKSHVSQIMSVFEADNRMHCAIEARRLGILA